MRVNQCDRRGPGLVGVVVSQEREFDVGFEQQVDSFKVESI